MEYDLSALNICFLAGTLGQGGAEQQLYYMVRTLQNEGASVRVLGLMRGEFWESRIQALGVPVIWVGERRSRLARLRRIAQELRRDRPHFVQSQHFYCNPYAALAARMTGTREIGAIRNDVFSEVRANGLFFGNMSLRIPRVLVANSETAIRNAVARKVSPRKLMFLPNCVDTDRFHPGPVKAAAPLRLLSVGRLVEQKRHDLFLRCLGRLRKTSGLEVRGTIVGSGPLRSELEVLAKRLDLLPHGVEFAGAADDMPAIYRESDILVLSSGHEGTPNVLLEAMSCGLPIVATRVGGVPEIVADGSTGLLASPDDEAELTGKIRTLVVDENLRNELGCRARKSVETGHSLRGLPARLAGLYGKVAATCARWK